jgi:hypothetical protein
LTPKETGVLQTAAQIPAKIPSEKQSIILMEVIGKARLEGMVVGESEEESA